MGLKTMDYIQVGDTVLIAGFYGDEMRFVNNKLAYVNHIVLINNIASLNYAAHVQVTPMLKVPVNFLYLYNTKNLFSIDKRLVNNTFFTEFAKNKELDGIGFTVNNEGDHAALCNETNGKLHYLTISTQN